MSKEIKSINYKLLSDSMEHKEHYKLYKSGRRWLVGGVATLSFAVASLAIPNFGTNEVHAATSDEDKVVSSSVSQNSQAIQQQSVPLQSKSITDASSEESTKSRVSSDINDTQSVDVADETDDNATPTTNDTDTSSKNATTSTTAKDADTTSASPTASTITKDVNATSTNTQDVSAVINVVSSLDTSMLPDNTAITATDSLIKIQLPVDTILTADQKAMLTQYAMENNVAIEVSQLAPANPGTVTVTKDNFLDYFQLNGSATYDPTTGIITLTEDENNESGNVTLQNKITASQSFTLTGELYIGDKSQPNGADAFGWKADTYWDEEGKLDDTGYFDADPAEFKGTKSGNGYGNAFGAFVYTEETDGKYKVFTYDEADNPAQQITEPDGSFKSFTINYDADTKTMTITYDGKTWTQNVTDYLKDDTLAFFVAASTGSGKNLQQFKIDSFTYVAYGTAHVHYVDDTTGQEIIGSQEYDGDLSTTLNLTSDIQAQIDTIESLDKGYQESKITVGDNTTFDTSSKILTYTMYFARALYIRLQRKVHNFASKFYF